MFVEASEWHYRERDRTTLQREGQNYSHKTSTAGTSIYWFNIQSLSTRLLRILPSTCNHCMHAETVFTGLPPINMQSLSTCGNCIHWSTSIQHAIIVYMRKLYSLVFLHSTCNYCLHAETVFTGLPPFNMQSLSTCENCIHWSTSIQHIIIVYMRKLYSLVYLHPTCNHCLHAETVFTGLPPFNMQSMSTCENCIHWSTSIQHAIIVYMRKLYSLVYLHSTCSHCLHAETVFTGLPPFNMQSLSTCENCIHWSTSIQHAIIVYVRKLYSLVYLHSTCNHCLYAKTVFTGLPPSNMQSLSTCGNCIHWSTSIQHAIYVYVRKLYSLVYLHSTCNHCLYAKTVFTGLPPFNMQSLSTCGNCIHWSTSIQHAIIVYVRKLYSLVYLHSTCNHCLYAKTVFTGLPPFNMQSLSTCGNCIHWSTSIQHAIIVYVRKLYSLVYLHSTCNHCLYAKTVFTGLPPFNMQSLSTCGNCIHWSTSIQHAIIVYMRKLYSLFYRHPTCSHCLHAEAVSSIQYAIIFTHTYQRPPPPTPTPLSLHLSLYACFLWAIDSWMSLTLFPR